LSIVRALGDAQRSLTLSETAAATRLYKSTVLRLFASLIRAGFVFQDRDGRYRLGSAIYRLAGAYQHKVALEHDIMPVLKRITEETGESVGFFVGEGNKRYCLLRVDSPHRLRHHIELGEARPIDLGAAGRVLRLFANGPLRVKPSGLAALPIVVLGDDVPDLAAIAVPIFGSGARTLGALSVSGPISRFDRTLVANVKVLLREVAVTLTNHFGGDSSLFKWRPHNPKPTNRPRLSRANQGHSRRRANGNVAHPSSR
jgi:DNA-binding IclR family transcriptional regulator